MLFNSMLLCLPSFTSGFIYVSTYFSPIPVTPPLIRQHYFARLKPIFIYTSRYLNIFSSASHFALTYKNIFVHSVLNYLIFSRDNVNHSSNTTNLQIPSLRFSTTKNKSCLYSRRESNHETNVKNVYHH